jgi:hypothetical protein
MKRRDLNIFSLSFLDCITCGLGAIILLFVIVNARGTTRQEAISATLEADTGRLAAQVSASHEKLADLRNALAEIDAAVRATQGQSSQVITVLENRKLTMADREKQTLASKAHINRLKSDLKALEEERRRLEGGAKTRDELGEKLRPFPGQGDRQYLTDLKVGGRRILILVDASASMLDESVVGVIRRRNLPDRQKKGAPKWQRAVRTVDWLTAQLPPASRFQIVAFNETAWPVIKGSEGTWLDAGSVDRLDQAVGALRRIVPAKGTSLLKAAETIQSMSPPPDNIFLIGDGLPTMGARRPWRRRVSAEKRLSLFNQAAKQMPQRTPVNIILLPMEGDPIAADAYWRLARRTRGSFFCPAKDWP